HSRYDFFFHIEHVLLTAARAWAERREELCELDRHRINEPNWFQSERINGGALYVDLFGENLSKLREHVGYFKDLGLTYLHLMPLFAVRPGNNDGGYAISTYRSVDPRLGTIEDLRLFAADLRKCPRFRFQPRRRSGECETEVRNREFRITIFPDRTEPGK
ncbi:MAG: alpha-amylase family glycosyl hydrolase, partial [Pseudohongiellaceae bacterium]